MKLTLEIRNTEAGDVYRVYDEYHSETVSICGTGWAIMDAVDDFVEGYNRLAFYDDDTPIYLRREDIVLKRSSSDCFHD